MYSEQSSGAAKKIVYLMFLLCALGACFVVGKLLLSYLNDDMTLIAPVEEVCENEDALDSLEQNGVPVPRQKCKEQ